MNDIGVYGQIQWSRFLSLCVCFTELYMITNVPLYLSSLYTL